MPSEQKRLRVAITGGGVAGAALIHALVQHPHVDAHIFESAPEFREAGLAIGLNKPAQESLALLSPSGAEILTRAQGVVSKGSIMLVGSGPDVGTEIDRLDITKMNPMETIVQRADLLRTLLEGVPQERMHVKKQLTEIYQPDEGESGDVVLKFSDGTEHACDVLVGADGIRSVVRRYILGEDDVAAHPRSTESYILWMMRPFEQAQKLLGKDLVNLENHHEYIWLTDGTVILHNISAGGKLVQFAACVYAPEAVGEKDWMKSTDVETEETKFAHWPQNFKDALSTFLKEEEGGPKRLYLWEHPHARTYVKGTVVATGDAAHATTPWQGSGCGMSIEDAVILSSLLSRSHSRAEAAEALQVFDEVRRPRTQSIVESSRATGKYCLDGSITDLSKSKGNVVHRWNHIFDFDIAKSRDEAIELFEKRAQR